MKNTNRNQVVENCATELEGISMTLSTISYAIIDGTKDCYLTPKGIDELLFTVCNHIDRIAADLQEATNA